MARVFANQTTDKVAWTGGPLMYNQTNGAIFCWFNRNTVPGSGQGLGFFIQWNNTNKMAEVYMDRSTGKIGLNWNNTAFPVSSTRWDDNAWHRLAVLRNSASPYLEIYVDGVSDGSSTTDPGTSALGVSNQEWGRNGGDANNSSFGGSLARCGFIAGTTPTIAQIETFLKLGLAPVALSQWLEMGLASPEVDWSGNGLSGTVTAATVGANPTGAQGYGHWRNMKRAA